MYIGKIEDGTGLHNMVCEVVKNAVNEGLSGFADRVDVILGADGSCTVQDNGRGIPTAVVDQGISGARFIMTRLYTRGRFWQQILDSLPGVGMCVVNALSEWLELRIWRQEKEFFLRFLEGEPQAPLRLVGDAKGRRGAHISFLSSSKIFPETVFVLAVIEQRPAELALLAPNIPIVLTDRR
jgi:DNA gyrase subunit B